MIYIVMKSNLQHMLRVKRKPVIIADKQLFTR